MEEPAAVGLSDLIKLLKKHAKEICSEEKEFMTVGVVGQPNTGK